MEGGFTVQDYHIFCWVIKFAYYMPATCHIWIVAHSMNTYSMDYTTQNNKSPKVLDELSSQLFLPEDFIPM